MNKYANLAVVIFVIVILATMILWGDILMNKVHQGKIITFPCQPAIRSIVVWSNAVIHGLPAKISYYRDWQDWQTIAHGRDMTQKLTEIIGDCTFDPEADILKANFMAVLVNNNPEAVRVGFTDIAQSHTQICAITIAPADTFAMLIGRENLNVFQIDETGMFVSPPQLITTVVIHGDHSYNRIPIL